MFQRMFVPLAADPAHVPVFPIVPVTLADWALLFSGNLPLIVFWVGGALFFAHFLGFAPFALRSPYVGPAIEPGAPVPLAIATAPVVPVFAQRLDRLAFAATNAIRADDHYLRVFAPGAEELILYRFTDAVAELSVHGWLRVHRSFCVRVASIAAFQGYGRSPVLVMDGGLRIPVSERYRAMVELAVHQP